MTWCQIRQVIITALSYYLCKLQIDMHAYMFTQLQLGSQQWNLHLLL